MEFHSPLRRRSPLPVIETTNLRVALLDSTSGFSGVRAFPPHRWSSLETFSPNVLAGSMAQFHRLLERINLRTVNAGAVDHSVFVITQLGDSPLPVRFRDRLWQQFMVPVYEVYVDENSRLLAYECEAQQGWHVSGSIRFAVADGELLLERGSRTVRTGLDWRAEDAPCACGRPGPRLLEPDWSVVMSEPLLAVSA